MEQSSRAEVVQRVENLVKVMKTMMAMTKMAMTKGEMMTMKKAVNDDKDDGDDDDDNDDENENHVSGAGAGFGL